MRYLIITCLLLVGCVPSEAKQNVRRKHAELYVYSRRLDDPKNKPTPEQNEIMIKSIAKDYESLDRMINNWKPNPTMGETTIEPGK